MQSLARQQMGWWNAAARDKCTQEKAAEEGKCLRKQGEHLEKCFWKDMLWSSRWHEPQNEGNSKTAPMWRGREEGALLGRVLRMSEKGTFFPTKAASDKIQSWHLNLFVGHRWGSAPPPSEMLFVVAVFIWAHWCWVLCCQWKETYTFRAWFIWPILDTWLWRRWIMP